MRLVVSQPMFLPWIGLFEQLRLADIFVHYDDVQMPQGRSFITRVQVKSASGARWMTAPLDRRRSGSSINESWFQHASDWRKKHLSTLHHCYAGAPHFGEMLALSEKIYGEPTENVALFNANAIELIAVWLGLEAEFVISSKLEVGGRSSQRLLDLCKYFGADTYITGLGALKYLDHELFDRNGVNVEYIVYEKRPYPQRHGDFTPFVTILDAIANCGMDAVGLIKSSSVHWKDYAHEPN